MIQCPLLLEVAEHVGLLVVKVVELIHVEDLDHRVLDLLLHKVQEALGGPLAPVLLLPDLSVPDVLNGGILGDVELGAQLAVLVTVNLKWAVLTNKKRKRSRWIT